MKASNSTASTCRCCHYYKLTGRRGGYCEILGVSVRGEWKGCNLAIIQFAADYKKSLANRELANQQT